MVGSNPPARVKEMPPCLHSGLSTFREPLYYLSNNYVSAVNGYFPGLPEVKGFNLTALTQDDLQNLQA